MIGIEMVTVVTITIGKTICKFIGHLTFKLSLRSCYYYHEKNRECLESKSTEVSKFFTRTHWIFKYHREGSMFHNSLDACNEFMNGKTLHSMLILFFSAEWKQSGQTSFIFWPLKVYWNDSPLIGMSIHCVYKVNVWSEYSLSEMTLTKAQSRNCEKRFLGKWTENCPFSQSIFQTIIDVRFQRFCPNKAKLKHKAQ